jgi:hypothetical protein
MNQYEQRGARGEMGAYSKKIFKKKLNNVARFSRPPVQQRDVVL